MEEAKDRVFEANPGFPWFLLLKIVLGSIFLMNLLAFLLVTLQTPELLPEVVIDGLPTLISKSVPSYTDRPSSPNIRSAQLYPALCELEQFTLVGDYKIKACYEENYWDDFRKLDLQSIYIFASFGAAVTSFLLFLVYHKFPRVFIFFCILAAGVLIGQLVIIGRNNKPSRGENEWSVLQRFLTNDIVFIDYRAVFGINTFIGGILAKQTFAIEPSPLLYDKLTRLLVENDLVDVERSNICISDTNTTMKSFLVQSDDVDQERIAEGAKKITEDIKVNVTCTTLPAFIKFSKIKGPMFINFDSEDAADSWTTIASWKPWIAALQKGKLTKPVLYVSVYELSEDDTRKDITALKQAVCDVLNSFDYVLIDHYSFMVKKPLLPENLCSNCRYLVLDKDMATYYNLNYEGHH